MTTNKKRHSKTNCRKHYRFTEVRYLQWRNQGVRSVKTNLLAPVTIVKTAFYNDTLTNY